MNRVANESIQRGIERVREASGGAEQLRAAFPQAGEVLFGQISPALVVHTGPGLVGIGVSVL